MSSEINNSKSKVVKSTSTTATFPSRLKPNLSAIKTVRDAHLIPLMDGVCPKCEQARSLCPVCGNCRRDSRGCCRTPKTCDKER